ncbi:MAG: DinB family protein [Planctomycetes bacterium]|nr:DinB family protein [Planctomycetota bacterium]
MPRPDPTEYAGFFGRYVDLVPEADVLPAMAAQLDDLLAFLRAVPDASAGVCHPPYTWTFKEVVGHVADGERVFGCRALRFGRADATPLPAFDENVFAVAAEYNRLPFADVVSEFEAARRSNLWMFRNMPEAAWTRSGPAADNRVSVRALAYIIVGHARHHAVILRKRLVG